MFTSISWVDYLTIIIILLGVYYLFIAIRYYSNELKQLLPANRRVANSAVHESELEKSPDRSSKLKSNQTELFDNEKTSVDFGNVNDDIFYHVEQLTIQLKERIAEAADKKYIKEEFILSLQLLTKKYHFLKGSSFFTALNNLIASECEKYDYVHLTEDDRLRLWNE